MSSVETPAADTSAIVPQRPVWQSAIVVLIVLFTLSEAVYLVLGGIAKTCLAPLATCGPWVTEASRPLFAYYATESGANMFSNTFSIGLPGFNNIFYLFVAGVLADFLGILLATAAASILIGFLVVWGFLAISAKQGVALRLVLAIGFAIGWFAFYNYTEASVYGADFLPLARMRYLEIPIGAASLFVASFFALRRG